jgi:hypothetical protein
LQLKELKEARRAGVKKKYALYCGARKTMNHHTNRIKVASQKRRCGGFGLAGGSGAKILSRWSSGGRP